MAPLLQSELDEITAHVMKQLSETNYNCTSLVRLTNGTTNFVFRGTLAQPLSPPSFSENQAIETVIIKHTASFAALNKDLPIHISRSSVEASILHLLNEFPDTIPSVKIPHLYLFDQNSNIQVLQDIPSSVDVKTVLVSPTANVVLSQSLSTSIGYSLGVWLRSFHSWTSERSRANSPRDLEIGQNEHMRKLKYLITYDAFIKNLEQFPGVLEGHKEALEEVKLMASNEFTKTTSNGQEEEEEEWGIIHGDFWTGNILMLETQQPTEEPKLFVVDWEFVQFGHRAYDIGQMIGDLLERKHFNDAEAAVWIIDAFIKGYGAVSEDMAFRIAIHAGVQLITWVVRGPALHMRSTGAMQRAPAAMMLGMNMVLRGNTKDKNWFKTSILAGLFMND